MEYKSYNVKTFKKLDLIKKHLSKEEIEDIEIVAQIFPFKINNYVINELIDWDNYKDDPIFRLLFPHKEMLKDKDFEEIKALYKKGDIENLKSTVNRIRFSLNPHPAGQLNNVPQIDEKKLEGSQHKYKETILFFPKQGQTCHAFCSFCFRWPQFVGIDHLKFASKEAEVLVEYIKAHPEITDVLFTGGDPLIMSAKLLNQYIDAILKAKIPHLQTIRFGSKTLGFWPYRYTSDKDSQELLNIFRKIKSYGINVAFMAHFNHYNELKTSILKEAVEKIIDTGAVIRTQSPLLRHINSDPAIWQEMWKRQVNLSMVPYYMFIARDTGAQDYFGVSLYEAWKIFQKAYSNLSGIARTVRGPSMSANPGKISINGVSEINGEKVFILNMIQAKDPSLVNRPFFAKFNEKAMWIDDLEPAFSEKFIFA